MESLKLDLNNVGKSRYLYNEVFTLSEYKEFRNSNEYTKYLEALKACSDMERKLYDLPVSKILWLVPLSFIGLFFSTISSLAAVLLIVSLIVGILRTVYTYKKLSKEDYNLKDNLTKLSDKNSYLRYFYITSDYYSSDTSIRNFNRLTRYLDKLMEYDSITVYHLEKELSYPIENYNHHFKHLLFKDTTTGKFFTYAYSASISSSDVEIVKLLTIFDIDDDTFEYKPRV